MNSLTQRLLATTAALLLAGTAATAMARGPGGCDDGHSGPRAEKMQQRKTEQMAKHQQALKAALKLSPAQEAAWATFTSAMQPPGQGTQKRPNREEMAQLTTPQRIEKMQALKAERDADMAKRMEATKACYTTLTPEQQKVFDQQSHPKHPRHGKGETPMHHG